MDNNFQAYLELNEAIYKRIEETIGNLINEDQRNANIYQEQLSNLANGLRIEVQGGTPTFKREDIIFKRHVDASYQRKQAKDYSDMWNDWE